MYRYRFQNDFRREEQIQGFAAVADALLPALEETCLRFRTLESLQPAVENLFEMSTIRGLAGVCHCF